MGVSDAAVMAAIDASKGSQSTKNIYKARLRVLVTLTGKSIDAAVLAPKKSLDAMKKEYDNPRTRRNMITAVLAVFKHCDALARRKGAAAARSEWTAAHDVLKHEEESAYSKNIPLNQRQDDHYVSIDDIDAKLARMLDDEDRHSTLDKSMDVLLLLFYSKLAPKRSDYGALRIYRPSRDSDDVDENYVILPFDDATSATDALLVIQSHKTRDVYKELIEPIHGIVLGEILESLQKHPRDHVFVGRGGKPMTNNAYTKFVIRRFSRLFDGRAAGTALLRHAFISERVDFNRMSVEERADIARRMGHSTALQEKVYKWVDRGPWSALDTIGTTGTTGTTGTITSSKNKGTREPRKLVTCECKTRAVV